MKHAGPAGSAPAVPAGPSPGATGVALNRALTRKSYTGFSLPSSFPSRTLPGPKTENVLLFPPPPQFTNANPQPRVAEVDDGRYKYY